MNFSSLKGNLSKIENYVPLIIVCKCIHYEAQENNLTRIPLAIPPISTSNLNMSVFS